MRRGAAGIALALALTSCGLEPPPVTTEYDMEVKSVELPATVGADADLDVVVEVTVGGCSSFARFEAVRTAARLTLRAIGTTLTGPRVTCPAYIGWVKQSYTDPGTPARTGPFEVVVNGTSYGQVSVQPGVPSP